MTGGRVLCTSLFLPYTVDFQIAKDKKSRYTAALTAASANNNQPPIIGATGAPGAATTCEPNTLIDSLAAQQHQQQPSLGAALTTTETTLEATSVSTTTPLSADEETDQEGVVFDFKKPEQLIQPKSKAQREEDLKRLPALQALHHRRQNSIDSPSVFDEAPWTVKPGIAGNIGLHNAMVSIRDQIDKKCMWVGTLGMSTDPLSQQTRGKIQSTMIMEHDSYPVMPSDAEFECHYNRYCKQVLWPYFHYVVQDDLQNMMYQDDAWDAYVSLNQRFADVIVENYQDGDILWVNDYHLMLLPGMLRKRIPNAIIGFFLHIPFPSSELFRCLPTRKQLLEGMLEADLIGFQTYSFARHFLQTCSRILSLDATPSGIQMDTHYVTVGIYPIGIDINALNKKRSAPEVLRSIDMLRDKYAGKKLIVARDKLDYIKGVRQKLLAFEQFLVRHPEWRGKVVLIQIALSTAEKNELRAHITDVVSRVNSKFSNISYQPIVFLHQDISFSQYLALLTAADASLITPLRDGMNLTSHEYIVCQENNHGPLILSEFTGTYGSFGACLRVNPWDYRQVGNAIHEALSMSEEEKTGRWKELYKSIVTNSAQNYASTIISELSKIRSDEMHRMSAQIPPLDVEHVKQLFKASKNPLFLFDYGGTLVPHGKDVGANDLDRLTELLTKLTKKSAVYVISGRTRPNIDRDLGGIPNLGLSAENGYHIRPRGEDWQQMHANVDLSWMPAVKEIFRYYTERTPGASLETKDISIVWHYRKTTVGQDAQFAKWQAGECQNHIADSVNKNFQVHAVTGKTTIEVLPHDINKSAIANRIMQDINPDFVLSIGDDRMDEDMFAFLNKQKIPNVITCTVGSRSTEAKYFVPNVQSVHNTLEAFTTATSTK
ncbi:glycosyltransferase family 20-domain-containing protein [Zychaea mexicana]|uniref:glycosyltransferase family 20-domain-containing protein n=1 Tax=Zychaea mexicana TaxID=64656 RepID=UPI0022FF27EC|nr:glycosyltransferase family 20-domain-containing protein [Zychaea mexicana]KAI9496750.1 glycosyltransferase family 20-domain-containing protein [Zychaea mexicana]